MSDHDALLRGVLEAPEDDLPRLAYADWLEENGDAGGRLRAEFIRVQLELERLSPGPEEHKKASRLLARYRKGAPVRMMARTPATLLMREAILMDDARLLGRLLPACLTAGPGKGYRLGPGGQVDLAQGGFVVFRRGFLDSLMLSAHAWVEYGDCILAGQPVREVALGQHPDYERVHDVSGPGRVAGSFYRLLLPTTRGVHVWRADHEEVVAGDVQRRLLEAEWPRVSFRLPAPA